MSVYTSFDEKITQKINSNDLGITFAIKTNYKDLMDIDADYKILINEGHGREGEYLFSHKWPTDEVYIVNGLQELSELIHFFEKTHNMLQSI